MQNYHNFKVDLTNCDKEPIHIIGQIQGHGFLLVIDSQSYSIEQTSDNIGDFIPSAVAESLLGRSLLDLLPQGSKGWFEETFLTTGHDVIELGGKKFYGFNHSSSDKVIIECESYGELSENSRLKELDKLSLLADQLSLLEDPVAMAQLIAREIQQYLNYDRVNVMKFDKSWNSEVIGESLKEGSDPFLGHRFPASDIPVPARQLLLRKPIRQIPDVNAKAIKISPYINPSTGTPTDILKSELRNPSEIHLEYLRNMEVGASISFSIKSKGKLWGIVTCHHYKPKFVDVWKRRICHLMTQTLAGEIASGQKLVDSSAYKALKQHRAWVVAQLEEHKDLASGLSQSSLRIMDITESFGAAVILNQKIYIYGSAPTEEEIRNIISWIGLNNHKKIFCTKSLWKLIPEANQYKDVACGLFALEISRYNHEYLLFFKPEIYQKRIWGGNPEKPELKNGNYIHPRRSFEKWEEIVRGKSLKWKSSEVEAAKIFVKDLTAFQLRDQTNSLRHLYAQLEKNTQRLVIRNNQLEDFGLIMAHNLRGPMNNVLLLHEVYRDEPTDANTQFIFRKIPAIVENMIATMADLNKIVDTRLEDDLPSEPIDLAELIDREWENLQTEEIQSAEARLKLDLQVPVFYLPKIYAESILHNFISNALKYRSLNRQPQISIKTWEQKKNVFLSISDNGLGMDLKAVGKNLFGLYKTFHVHEQAKGMGLYLTKMQVDALGGDIKVRSETDRGTTFTVRFPKARGLTSEMKSI